MEWQTANKYDICVTSGFHHEAAENCTLLDSYTVSSGNFLLTFWTTYQSHPQGSKILILDSGFKILEPWGWDWWVAPKRL